MGDGTPAAHKKITKTKATQYSEATISRSLKRGESSMTYTSYDMVKAYHMAHQLYHSMLKSVRRFKDQ
jgi:hypothetical protein